MSYDLSEYHRFTQLQQDAVHRLASDPITGQVPVILQKTGDIEQQVLEALGVLHSNESGRSGACIIVMLPDFEVTNPNASGVDGEMVLTARCLDMPLINDGDHGIKIDGLALDCGVLALRALRVLGHWLDHGVAKVVQPKGAAIQPYTRDADKGLRGFDATVRAPSGVSGGDKVPTPTIAGDSSSVTLACSEPGASIYYTTDGGYPGSGNAAATLYSAPFSCDAGTLVRAAAQTTAGVPSDPQFAVIAAP